MAERKFRTAIPDSEWEITIQLTQGDDNHKVGDPIVMHFADSYVAKNVERKVAGVDWLVWRRIDEAVPALKRAAAKAKKARKA